MELKYTLDQARERFTDYVGIRGIPNKWWPIDTGSDCVGFCLERLGIRTRNQMADHLIFIHDFEPYFDNRGFDKISTAHLAPGDLVVENWQQPAGHIPQHMEYVYSIDHKAGRITTISANTSPAPGILITPRNRGSAKKTRPLTEANFLHGWRPPYPDPVTTVKQLDRVRRIATFLNHNSTAPFTPTRAADDGQEGPVYWRLVQTWGRVNFLYPSKYVIDGVPGPQTRKVEAAIWKIVQKQK